MTNPSPSSNRLRPYAEEADEYQAVLLQINDHWRVIVCPLGLQWILQVRKGERGGRPRWNGRKFNRWRDVLIRNCEKFAGPLSESHLAVLSALPEIIGGKA